MFDLVATVERYPEFLPWCVGARIRERSPDLVVRLKQYVYLGGNGGGGHGSVYEDDRHVPVVFLGPGIPKGEYKAAAGPEDIAPTLAKMLDIPYPLEWDTRVLTEIVQ